MHLCRRSLEFLWKFGIADILILFFSCRHTNLLRVDKTHNPGFSLWIMHFMPDAYCHCGSNTKHKPWKHMLLDLSSPAHRIRTSLIGALALVRWFGGNLPSTQFHASSGFRIILFGVWTSGARLNNILLTGNRHTGNWLLGYEEKLMKSDEWLTDLSFSRLFK